MEEYSVAAQVWKLSATMLCEMQAQQLRHALGLPASGASHVLLKWPRNNEAHRRPTKCNYLRLGSNLVLALIAEMNDMFHLQTWHVSLV